MIEHRELGKKCFLVDFIDPDGLVGRSSALHKGDIVTAINGKNTNNLSMKEVIDVIRSTEIQLILQIQREGHYRMDTFDIKITKSKDETYGFKFITGRQRPRVPNDVDMYVTKVSNSVTTVDNETDIKVGDVILAINETPLKNMDFKSVQKLIMDSNEIIMTILRVEYSSPNL